MKTITIENKAAKIRLDQEVDGEFIRQLLGEIGEVYATATAAISSDPQMAADTLEIEINSPGGSIFDGYNLFTELLALRQRGVYVTATITGLAASMASVIAMSADHIRIVPMGRIMIHDASGGLMGNAEALTKYAEVLDGISADIAFIYSARTGIPETEVRAMMKRETWIKADEAKALGFVDEVLDIPKKALTDNHPDIRIPNKNMNFIDAIKRTPELEKKIVDLEAKATKLAESQSLMEVRATTAETSLAELKTEVDARGAMLTALQSECDAAKAALASESAKVVDLTAKLAAKSAEVEQVKSSGALAVASAAAATVASLGHQAIAAPIGQTSEDFMSAYAAEKDPVKKARMWKDNRPKMVTAFNTNRN